MISDDQSAAIKNLLDINAIKTLKARYCDYADSGKHPEEFAALFTEGAVLDEGEDGIFHGRQTIEDMYNKIQPFVSLNQHLVFNPIIEINEGGNTASGKWRLLQLCTVKHSDGDKAFWACGYYQERYVKTESDWKFEHVEARVHFCSPYEDGWAKTPFGEFLPPEAISALGLDG